MAKLIIYVSGQPSLNGYRIREFKWSEPHRKYIYLGQEIEENEFNALMEKAARNNADLHPKVMVIPQPELTDEQKVEQAEKVIEAIHPERLRKKTGARAMMEVA